ncbi:MAG: phospholipid carrier-dependent glycosyltransferase [Pseudonocardiales bacterium]|nr:phospholipid carrier-dependent glycosyltransferase [Pseudonocardiales bacterium]
MAGSVRARSLEHTAKRKSSDPAATVTAVARSKGSGIARPAWRRINMPTELVLLTFFAAATRFAAITYPHAIVFDEVYFRETALRYLEGSYFFDLHPPLGKLLLAGWAKLFGVTATPQSTDPVVVLRILPALAGTALVAVFYLFLRELTASRRVATFGAALLLLDNAILVESRFILIDSMLLLFGLGALTLYIASWRRAGRAHWILLASSAVLAGMAASTKLTGLTAIGVIGLVWLVRTLGNRVSWRRALPQVGILLIIPALVYVSVFAIHFSLLRHSGPGDAFMSEQFQSTLIGNPHYNPAARMSFTDKFVELNKAMHSYELSLNSSKHPYSSSWLSWPLLKRPVYYWTGTTGTGGHGYIYLQGNPLLWWGLLAGAVVVAVGWLRRPELFKRHVGPMALLGLAWVANFLPFATIVRPMFLYHYFFALMFCLAAVSIGLGLLAGWMTDDTKEWRFPSWRSAALYWGIIGVALGSFLFFAPISYGLPLTDSGLSARIWLDSWR